MSGLVSRFRGLRHKQTSATEGPPLEISAKDIAPFVFIILVAFYVTVVNVGGNFIIHFIDEIWPLDPSEQLVSYFSAWSSSQMGGLNMLNFFNVPLTAWSALLSSFGMSIPAQEVVTWTGLQALAGIYFYIIVREFVLGRVMPDYLSIPIATVAGIVSFINYPVQALVWWDGLPSTFLLLGFGFMFLYYMLVTVRIFVSSGRINPLYVFLMIVSGSLGFSTNIPSNVSLLLLSIVLVPLPFLAVSNSRKTLLKLVASYGLVIAVIGVSSLWWLSTSYLASISDPGYLASSGSVSQNAAIFISSTRMLQIPLLFRGMYIPHFQFSSEIYTPFNTIVFNSLGAATSYFIPATLIAGCISAALYRKRVVLKFAYLLSVTFLLSLFMVGVNSPILPLLEYLNRNPLILQILRNPTGSLLYAFEDLLIISAALSFDILYLTLRYYRLSGDWYIPEGTSKRNLRKQTDVLRVVASVGIVLAILWLPFFSMSTPIYTGDAIPVQPFHARMQIPQYVQNVADYISGNLKEGYALLYPGRFISQNWTYGYDSYDALPFLMPNTPVIDGPANFLTDYVYQTIEQANTATMANYSAVLASMGIHYIVIEGQVGQTPYWSYTQTPDYSEILGGLNRTPGISLDAVIGYDYIYAVDVPPSVFTIGSGTVEQSALADGYVSPEINLTSTFYNISLVNSVFAPAHDFFPSWENNSIVISLNNSTKQSIDANQLGPPLWTPPPTYFNGIPLQINTTIFPYLILNFSTNRNAAISVHLITTPDLSNMSVSELQQNYLFTVAPYNNLGWGDNSLSPAYGGGYYTSTGKNTSMVVNLQAAIAGSASKIVNYIIIQIYPVTDSGQGLNGVPLLQWPGDQNVTITNISVGSNYFFPLNNSLDFTVLRTPYITYSALTSTFYNISLVNSVFAPAHDFFPSWENNSIVISLNNSTKQSIDANQLGPPLWTPPPTYFNGIPLQINTTIFPYLILNFSTNRNAAISVHLITTPDLSNMSVSELQQNYLFTVAPYNNLGWGDNSLSPAYGGGYYTSTGKNTSMVVNLQAAIAGSASKIVNYIIIQIYPVTDSGQGLNGVPLLQWPGDQNVTINFIGAGNTYSSNGSFIEPGSGFVANPPRVSDAPVHGMHVLTPSVASLATSATVTYERQGQYSFAVNLTLGETGGKPVLLIMSQNYLFSPWEIENGIGLSSWEKVRVDYSLVGFLIYPEQGAHSVSFTLGMPLQAKFISFIGLSAALIGVSSMVCIVLFIVNRDSWRKKPHGIYYRHLPQTGEKQPVIHEPKELGNQDA